MKTSAKQAAGFMIAATLSILALLGWMALRHDGEITQPEASKTAQQRPAEDSAEAKRKKEAVAKWLAEHRKKLEETKQELEKLKQQRQAFQDAKKKMLENVDVDGSIEFSPVERTRTTWTGHTDPDRVWHEQQRRARETLIRFDHPASASQR